VFRPNTGEPRQLTGLRTELMVKQPMPGAGQVVEIINHWGGDDPRF